MAKRFRTHGGIERDIRAIFRAAGIKPAFGYGSKHPFAEWIDASGETQRMFFAGSPSSGAALRMALAELKDRLLATNVNAEPSP